MKRVLLFAGTTEGRTLAQQLANLPVECTAFVATEYGKEVLLPITGVHVHSGRMEEAAIQKMLHTTGADLLIDATHPYAVQVSQNLQQACRQEGIEYLRVVRERQSHAGCEYYTNIGSLIQQLNQLTGNILLTTGSKNLQEFTQVSQYRQRLYPRVLPAEEALHLCRQLQIPLSHVIAMQGPFSQQLNEAILRQFEIAALVTKDSGKAGGFAEKILAANAVGIPALVLERGGTEAGVSLGEAQKLLYSRYRTGGAQ